MKSTSIVLSICTTVILAACGQTGPAEPTDILGQAAEGKLMCVNPDAIAKTCSAIISYSRSWTGTITESGEILIPGQGPISMELSSTAEVQGAQTCGIVNEADLRKSTIRYYGSPVPPEVNKAAVEKIVTAFRPLFGRKSCEVLQLEQGQLQKSGSVEGIDMNLPVKLVAWISPDTGYRVAPN